MVLKVRRTFGAWVKMVPLFWFAGRPEVVPYIRALGGVARVGGGVPDTPPYATRTCIGAFLPLPAGEVAMPSGIDGEGLCTRIGAPHPPYPLPQGRGTWF